MTKARIPGSFEAAVMKVLKQIGPVATGKAVERCPRTIYEWSDPDSDTLPTLLQAVALDAAHRLGGGEDAPFRDALGYQAEIEVDRQAPCRSALATDTIELIRESGELHAALFVVGQPGASLHDHRRAMVEAQQVDGVLRRIRWRLPSFLRPVTSMGPGRAGGIHP